MRCLARPDSHDCSHDLAENILAQDPNIGTAIVFGHGRMQPGLLVEPTQPERGSEGGEQWVEKYKDLIW